MTLFVQFKTPARRTRASQRIATRNVIAARKEAKLRHRLEKGPVYTNEEIEVRHSLMYLGVPKPVC